MNAKTIKKARENGRKARVNGDLESRFATICEQMSNHSASQRP